MKSRTFRRTFALFAEKQITEAPKIVLLLLALALPAVAQKPTIQLIPFTSFFVPAAAACGIRRALHSPSGKAEQRKTDPVRQHGDNCRTALCDNNEPQHRKNHQPEHQWAAADQLFRQHHGRAVGSVCDSAASRRGDSGGSAAPVTHLWPGGSHGRSTIQYQLDTKCDWYSARRVSVVAVRIVGCNEATRTGREHERSGRKAAKRPTRRPSSRL
jgi:hypothetical protein